MSSSLENIELSSVKAFEMSVTSKECYLVAKGQSLFRILESGLGQEIAYFDGQEDWLTEKRIGLVEDAFNEYE